MQVLDGIGIALVCVALALLGLALRRALIAHGGGTVEMSLRLRRRRHGQGWSLGVARYSRDDLQWFRVFSYSPRPRRTLSRGSVEILDRRTPTLPESLALQKGMSIVTLQNGTQRVELGMTEPVLTGFLSWLEAAAPGSALPPTGDYLP
jgi:hypothetical protein